MQTLCSPLLPPGFSSGAKSLSKLTLQDMYQCRPSVCITDRHTPVSIRGGQPHRDDGLVSHLFVYTVLTYDAPPGLSPEAVRTSTSPLWRSWTHVRWRLLVTCLCNRVCLCCPQGLCQRQSELDKLTVQDTDQCRPSVCTTDSYAPVYTVLVSAAPRFWSEAIRSGQAHGGE